MENRRVRIGMSVLVLLVVTAIMAAAGGKSESAAGADKPSLTIGMIYVGSVKDAGYNQAQKEGLEYVKKNVPGVIALEAENVPEGPEAERVMENMIQKGAKLIFPTSFGHMDPALNVAARHPDVAFMHAGGYKSADNFGTYFAATQTAFYPMGVAAGLMTKTNKLGFVIAMPIGFALGNVNAFHLGARSVNPNVTTYVVTTGSWMDRAKEATASNALLDQGVDVLSMHVDSPITVVQTAEERGAYSIGFQSTAAAAFAPKGWITGIGFTWGELMAEAARQVINGTWKPEFLRKGLEAGYLEVAPFGKNVPADVKKKATAAVEQIKSGYQPFTGPIKDQTGTIRIAAGESWDEYEQMGSFDWFVEGIVGEPK